MKKNDAPKCEIDRHKTKRWKLAGKLHRTDGPAAIYVNETKEWYLNGKLHREDGPVVEYPDGTKYWYLNGKLHRIDGPATEYASGGKKWCLNDVYLSEEEHAKQAMNLPLFFELLQDEEML